MQLNKIEKIVVIVILLGLILVGGYFLFVAPSIKKIESAQKTLDSNRTEQAALADRLSRLETIGGEIDAQKQAAVKFEGTFYPDLTTYETSEIAMAYMKKCNLEAHTISITPLSARDLTLEYYSPTDIVYDLKTYSASAKNSEGDGNVEVKGTFEENGHKYTISISNISDVSILQEDGTPVSTYTDKMIKMYKAALCRYVQENGMHEAVAATQATYEVKGKFSDYLKFLDYIYDRPRATGLAAVAIPMTTELKKDKDDDSTTTFIGEDGYGYSAEEAKNMVIPVTDDTEISKELTLVFFCVEPMNSLHTVDADGQAIVVDQRSAVY